MRQDEKFEIERAFDQLPHIVGASWATIWFRLNKIKNPTREEFRRKVSEFLEELEPLFSAYPEEDNFGEINQYIQRRKKTEIERIKRGENKEVEKRYDRYLDYG